LAPGEDPAEAAARVVHSCTALRLDGVKPMSRFDHVLTHRRVRFHPFRARARGRLRLSGYEASRWVAAASEVGVAAWAARLIGET
jgi:hypothetical protein